MSKEKELSFAAFFKGEDGRRYYYIPFDVPENVEKMKIEYSYRDTTDAPEPTNKNKIDFALVDPDGKQVGASQSRTREIEISECGATPGYLPCTPKAGTWQIIAGTDVIASDGAQVEYRVKFKLKERRWLKGDCHLHTFHSDGAHSPRELIEKCRKKGFSFIIITDHNTNSVGRTRPTEKDMLIIQGVELTTYLGHINLWGVERPFEGGYCVNDFEDMKRLVDEAKGNGATTSVNHPTCKNCTWLLPLEGFEPDCIEVWNGPMRIDNMTAIKLWHEQLLKGRRLGAVGGSDYHRDYVVTDLLGNPTTVVLAESNTTEDVLKALREGRSVITHDPDATMIYLTCGDAQLGDSVQWRRGIRAQVTVDKLKKGHRLLVYNNDLIVYNYIAGSAGEHTASFEVMERGFIRAEVLYEYNAVVGMGYSKVLSVIMPKDVGLPRPPFAWCLTNAIYFE